MDMRFVDELAAEIRRVDGGNALGAGALAEALVTFITARQSAGQERGEAVAWQYRVGTEGMWVTVNTAGLADHARQQGCEVRPLYAAPTAAQSRIAEMEDDLRLTENALTSARMSIATLEAKLTESREREGRMRAFIEKVSKQTPEKPDYWSSCGQCGNNQDEAEELLAALAAEKE